MKALFIIVALLAWPFITAADEIQPYRGQEIQPYKSEEVKPYRGKEIRPYKGRQVRPERGSEVQPYSGAGQARIFSKEDFDEMRQNDIKAGRTRESMSKGKRGKRSGSRNQNPYTDPYNSGGWNYNTNQSASPIWNPNSQ